MSFDQLYWVSLGGCALGFATTCHRRLAVPAAFAIAGALIYVQAFRFWNLTVDDAYISYRYAYNFAHGQGLVFNRGDHVEGYTNFGWVLLLSLTERLGAGIVTPARWMGYAADLGTLGVMWLLSRWLVSESTRTADIVFCGAALMFGALPATGYWATAGLEEPLFTLLALLALYRCIVERKDAQRLPLSAPIAFAAAITRPEGLLVAAVIFLVRAIDVARRERSPRSLAVWCLILLLPYAGYIGWRWSYYGYVLPNTYYQKATGGPTLDWQRYRDGMSYVRGFWMQTGAVLIFPLPLVAFTRNDRRAALLPLTLFTVLWTAYVAYVGGDFMSFHRFMLPVVPIVLLLAADSLMQLLGNIIRERPARLRSAAAVALGVIMAAWVLVVPGREEELLNFRRTGRSAAVQIAAWLEEQDPNTYVAVGAAGYVPFHTHLRTLDTLGLTDEHIAHGPQLSDELNVQGHRKGDGSYVLSREPDMIIFADQITPSPMTELQWRTRPPGLAAYNDLLLQPDLWELYEPAWAALPQGAFNFLRRKDSTRVQAERSAPLSYVELAELRARDLPGSCDNWILPRPPANGDYGYFYLTGTEVAPGAPRRAITRYHADTAGSAVKVMDLYEGWMVDQSRWKLIGTEHGELSSEPGGAFTIASFRAGANAGARTASVAISDDGTSLITSADFISPAEPLSSFYHCQKG
jgi:hypothetical protein